MLHTTSYDWLSRLAAIVDRSSFTEAVLLSVSKDTRAIVKATKNSSC